MISSYIKCLYIFSDIADKLTYLHGNKVDRDFGTIFE